MKILFISAIVPYPLHSGGQVRLYNTLKLLSKDHEITLYAYVRDEKERQFAKNLSFLKNVKLFYRGYVWQPKYFLRSLFGNKPLLMSSYDNKDMRDDIRNELSKEPYDLIHIEPFYVCPSLPEGIAIPIVVSEHNIEYEVYESYVRQFPVPVVRPLLGIDVRKIRTQEESVWAKAHTIITVSGHDRSVIEKTTGPGKKIAVVPNGVDTDYFSYENKTFDKNNLTCLFVGNFLWMPNLKAVEYLIGNIWPEIRKEFPNATLTIVGKHLPDALAKKAGEHHITYQPFVGDIRTAYQKNCILLAPMTISGGSKFKILEAMATGCMVITSKEGIEGIDATNRKHYIETNTASVICTNLRALQKNPKLFQAITKNARVLIEKLYDWKTITQKQSDIWKRTA